MQAIKERPEAIMINVPESFIKEHGQAAFRRMYERLGDDHEDDCFYHFISTIPKHEVTHAFICFLGKVQYKAIVVEYLKNGTPDVDMPTRNYLVVTGPMIEPPFEIPQRGFRGFRYCKMLF